MGLHYIPFRLFKKEWGEGWLFKKLMVYDFIILLVLIGLKRFYDLLSVRWPYNLHALSTDIHDRLFCLSKLHLACDS